MNTSTTTYLAILTKMQAEMKLEILQVNSELAELHREYVVNGKGTSPAVRAERFARVKHLELELFKITHEVKQEKLKAQQYKQHSEITILSSLITAAGFGHLVAEARVQALASLESTGMLAAYQTK